MRVDQLNLGQLEAMSLFFVEGLRGVDNQTYYRICVDFWNSDLWDSNTFMLPLNAWLKFCCVDPDYRFLREMVRTKEWERAVRFLEGRLTPGSQLWWQSMKQHLFNDWNKNQIPFG